MHQSINTADAPAAIGPYSQASALGDLIFTSGQIGLDPATGAFASDTVEGQTEQALKNLSNVLRAAGTDLDHVLKTTCFLQNMDDFAAFNSVYATFFSDRLPARSAVEVARLPKDALVEIEVIAYKD